MGTRHLTIVVNNNEVKLAQYGQWDGYPTGQGKTIADFLQNKLDLSKFKSKVSQLNWLTKKEYKNNWISVGADPNSDMVSMAIADKFKTKFPHLSRDIGAKVLELIQNNNLMEVNYNFKTGKDEITTYETSVKSVKNDFDFAADSLFCEYAYVIDLDNEVVEFYTGFNQNKFAYVGRFAELKPTDNKYKYYQCALHSIIPFSEFTVDSMNELENILSKESE